MNGQSIKKIEHPISFRPPVSEVGAREWLDSIAKQQGISRGRLIWDCLKACLGEPDEYKKIV